MAYRAEVTRRNPGCILFLIDQSASMSGPFGGQSRNSKAERLADAVNRLLFELTIRCTKDQNEGTRNYYDVGIIGYGTQVGSALGGELRGRDLVPIGEVADHPVRVEERLQSVEDGSGGFVEFTLKFPVWIDAVAQGGAPMCQGLRRAYTLLHTWVQAHPESFPPIVINITDGEATDGDSRIPAKILRQLATNDGNLLLFNLHLSSYPGGPILYPDSANGLPDEYAQQLFEMSSLLTRRLQKVAESEGIAVGPESRGFVFNADIVEVIQSLDLGT